MNYNSTEAEQKDLVYTVNVKSKSNGVELMVVPSSNFIYDTPLTHEC